MLLSNDKELINDRPRDGRLTEQFAERETRVVKLKIPSARQQESHDCDQQGQAEKGCDEKTDPASGHTDPDSDCDECAET